MKPRNDSGVELTVAALRKKEREVRERERHLRYLKFLSDDLEYNLSELKANLEVVEAYLEEDQPNCASAIIWLDESIESLENVESTYNKLRSEENDDT